MSDNDYSGRQYGDLASSVTSDPSRGPVEQETSIGFDKTRDGATVYTAYPSLMKRFLLNPEFTLDWYETNHSDRPAQRVEAEEYDEDGHDRRKPVYAVKGTIPVGCLKISQSARSSSGHADVVTAGVL